MPGGSTPGLDGVARRIAAESTLSSMLDVAVQSSRTLLDVDATFAATTSSLGVYSTSAVSGIPGEGLKHAWVGPSVGLGGKVAVQRSPIVVYDYAKAPEISHDWIDMIRHVERLRGMTCVPVIGPAGVDALLYAGSHQPGGIGDRDVELLRVLSSFIHIALVQTARCEQRHQMTIRRERDSLAGHLHDSVAQTLFGIGTTARRARSAGGPLGEFGQQIEHLAAHGRNELRAAFEELSATPDNAAVWSAVEDEALRFQQRTRRAVRTLKIGVNHTLRDDLEILLLDTIREGLRNVEKHTTARLVGITLVYEPAWIELRIEDDGDDIDDDGWDAAGSGLTLLARRAARTGGSLEFLHRRPHTLLLRLPNLTNEDLVA